MSDPDVTPEPLTDDLDPNVTVIAEASPLSTKRYHYRGFDLELDSVHSSPAERHHAVATWRRRINDLFPTGELDPVIVVEIAKHPAAHQPARPAPGTLAEPKASKPAKAPKTPKSRRSPRGPAA